MARVGQEEDLLRQLAELEQEARDADPTSDERWDLLSAGALDEAAEAELRRQAASSEDTARDFELFRPIGRDVKAKMAELGLAAVREDQTESTSTPPASESELEPPARLAPRDTRGSPARSSRPSSSRRAGSRRPRSRWWLAAAAVLVSVLASIPLLTDFLGPGSLQPGEPEPLASYRLEVHGGLQVERSAEDPPTAPENRPIQLAPDIRFTVTLVPESPVTQPAGEPGLEVATFLSQGSAWRGWPHGPDLAEISDQGAVRLTAVYGRDLNLDQGRWTLWLAVGRGTHLPSLEEVRSVVESGHDVENTPWQLRSVDLEILDKTARDAELD